MFGFGIVPTGWYFYFSFYRAWRITDTHRQHSNQISIVLFNKLKKVIAVTESFPILIRNAMLCAYNRSDYRFH
jgi:hypothetical protein